MGYFCHHAIVVIAFKREDAETARAVAEPLFANLCMITPIVESFTNGYFSFLVPPDGSKEGWVTSAEGDEARSKFRDWLNNAPNDGVYPAWAEIAFPEDRDAHVTEGVT